MAALKKYNTLPALFTSSQQQRICKPLQSYYAATEPAEDETGSVNSGESYDQSQDSTSDSGETHDAEPTTPGTSPHSNNKLRRTNSQRDLSPPDQNTQAEGDEEMLLDDDDVVHAQLTEWEAAGGLYATTAAFEGTLLLESSLPEITDWCAPIVWQMYLCQANQCTSKQRHQYTIPTNTPCPAGFAKLLTKAMPRYKGGLTRAIAVTHALLYLHRIKTCFHCTTVSSTPAFTQRTLQKPDLSDDMYNTALAGVAAQCGLFFAVGMHYASLWLLDCCPAENTYWKRYVHCVTTSHGIAWSRLVLQHWNYQINTSVEEWMSFSSQLLFKFPYSDDKKRSRLAAIVP